MKTKPKYLTLKISSLAVAVVAVAMVGITTMKHNRTDAATPVKPAVGAAVPSNFSTTGVQGWWQGATRKNDMALFQNNHDCFTSVQYYTGTIDAVAELQKLSVSQAGTGGSSTPGAVVPLTLQMNSGNKQYDLHQYSLTSADSSHPVMGGLELGYVQLSGGYVKVEGHCNTPDQLSATFPALQSVKYDNAE
jgi:hypothetical protein